MLAWAMGIFLLPSAYGRAEQSPRVDAQPPSTADSIADVFSQVGDEIFAIACSSSQKCRSQFSMQS